MRIIEAAAVALYRCGHSPLPIYAGEKKPGVYGGVNADGDKGPWYDLRGWQNYCTERASEAKAASWGRMADAKSGGIGVACGYGGLIAIDVDHPDLIEPIRAILPPILVEKVGRKGFTAFFRGDHRRDDVEWWEKKNYGLTVPNPENPEKPIRVGLLDFLAVGSQTVLPPSIHPDTGEPYRWTSERTLLNTPIADLPVFTDEHRAEMERVLRAHGWDAPELATPRRDAVERLVRPTSDDMVWHDDVNAVALTNLSAWVPDLGLSKTRQHGAGYRAVATWRGSGSGRSDAQRSANLSFHPTGIVDFGSGETFTPIRVVAKARGIPRPAAAAWLRERLGLPDERLIVLNAGKSGALKPTYPDCAVDLDAAQTSLHGVLTDFESQMLEWRTIRNQHRIKPPLIIPKTPVWGVRIDAGGGKSFAAAEKIAAWSRRGWRLAVAVPRVDLGERFARMLEVHHVTAQVYRGRNQRDPDAPDHDMCRNPKAVAAATALGVSVRSAVCERRIDGKLVHCPFFDVCGYEKQREASPDVWIITSTLLAFERPDFIAELDGLVIDEKFHDNAIRDAATVDTAELWRAKIERCSDEEHDFLTGMRAKLRAVADDNGNGPLSRAVLDKHQIFAVTAERAATLEQRHVTPDVLRPDMRESGLNLALHKHGARNRLARDTGAIWQEIALFLTFDHAQSGRIAVAGDKIALTPLRTFHPSWLAPTLTLDATLPPPVIPDAAVFGDEVVRIPSTVSVRADISIRWSKHVHVRQILSESFSKRALGIGEHAKPKPRNERNIVRFIRQRAALAYPGEIGVISYLGLRKRIEGILPANVRWMHFGATSGMNDFEAVVGLVVVGRWWLPPENVEAQASVLAGYPVQPIGEFYRKRTGGIRMADGSVIPATVECHSDPYAEAIRWSHTEGELLQAIGRLRPHRRSERCFLDLLCDVVLPITVNEMAEWDEVCPGAEADMMAAGVVLTNIADAMAAFDLKENQARGVGGFSSRYTYYRNHRVLPLRTFHYKKAGPGQKAYEGHYLPAILPGGEAALRAWLEERLGPVASLIVEPRPVQDPADDG